MKTKTKIEFSKGQTVRFAIKTRTGTTRGTGTVKKLPPKVVARGTGRLTVVDGDGKPWRPYPSEVKSVSKAKAPKAGKQSAPNDFYSYAG